MRDFQLPGRSSVIAENGLCATSHPLAAKTAISILEAGGNAVDAAIAGAVLLGICEPQMTGIGGDCFALIDHPDFVAPVGLNGSGRAPAALDAAALRAAGYDEMPLYGNAASVTVPGAIDAFFKLNNDYGKLGMDAILAPSIAYAEAGVPVAPRVAFDWALVADTLHGAAAMHYLDNGKAPQTGDRFSAAAQAEVLRRLAKDGRDAFYAGEVAEEMVASLRAAGGTHTMDDFAATKASYVSPITGSYRGMDLMELPPNGQGATALLMAGILSNFDLASLDPWGAARAHIEAEASKLAYDARDRFIAEDTPRLDHMLSAETAAALASTIDPGRAMQSVEAVASNIHKETIYITVVDRDRLSVSLIYSIFHSFGSRLATEKFGILFQNRGAGFSLEPGHPNEAAGGKRPMHTIIPAMLRQNGRTIMPFGVMGGAYQPHGHARFLTNVVDYGLDPQAAIDGPRSFPEGGGLQVERGYRDEVASHLMALGHKVNCPELPIGGAQAILIGENGFLTGASDPRKDGCALGY